MQHPLWLAPWPPRMTSPLFVITDVVREYFICAVVAKLCPILDNHNFIIKAEIRQNCHRILPHKNRSDLASMRRIILEMEHTLNRYTYDTVLLRNKI